MKTFSGIMVSHDYLLFTSECLLFSLIFHGEADVLLDDDDNDDDDNDAHGDDVFLHRQADAQLALGYLCHAHRTFLRAATSLSLNIFGRAILKSKG